MGYHWAEYSYPSPNRHLYENFLNTTYESYRDASPLEMIDVVFYEISYNDLRQDILDLYAGCSHQRKSLIMKMSDLRFHLRWLLQTGWLLLQTDYFPESWLDPDSFSFLQCPVPEKEVECWKPKSLSFKEQKKLTKTLSKLYYDVDVHDEIYLVESRIICYLDSEDMGCLSAENLKTRDCMLKTLEILTLIVLDFCKKRTKPDGIIYPKV